MRAYGREWLGSDCVQQPVTEREAEPAVAAA
jgi:hypothetical protein